MEQQVDFYSVALAKLLQTTPELGGSIVSFQDVSDQLSEDSDMKVGVFILRIGVDVYFVPCISKQDNVYPMDSIFFQSTNQFMPLTSALVESIIASSRVDQGKGAKIPTNSNLNPDVTTLITPPRTGKFVYASTSRLTDFMSAMPNYLKEFTLEKISAERSAYENLHKLFSIRDILAALKPSPKGAAIMTNASPVSIITSATADTRPEARQALLQDGYYVEGTHPFNRLAVCTDHYENHRFSHISANDGDSDWELVLRSAEAREAFIPKRLGTNTLITAQDARSEGCSNSVVALFTNGDYATADRFIAVGEKLDRTTTLDTLFKFNPPVLPKEEEVGDTFALMDADARLLGVFLSNRVTITNLGIVIQAQALAGIEPGIYSINAFHHFNGAPKVMNNELYIPFHMLALKLGNDITMALEDNINRAHKHSMFRETSLLGEHMDLAYDTVEFSVNGKPVGSEANVMTKLAVDQGIDPEQAKSFIKLAKERKHVKIYMSKQAGATDFKPAEIPQFGMQPTPQGKPGLNGSFMPNTQSAIQTGDPQTVEATIISELLQCPDLYELISEYLPDIEAALDKLGRTLFLTRIHINQLAGSNDTESIFAFLSQLKNTYKMLGSNYIKLKELIALKPAEKK